jgi:hypothetical protein
MNQDTSILNSCSNEVNPSLEVLHQVLIRHIQYIYYLVLKLLQKDNDITQEQAYPRKKRLESSSHLQYMSNPLLSTFISYFIGKIPLS